MRNLCHTCRPFHIMRAAYYRLYTKEGPLESNNPIFSNDRFISRISSKSVRPPHTAASLKRCVCKIEEVQGPEKSTLYLSLSEKKPLDDSARLGLRGNDGPGSSEVDPVVFVIDKGAAEKRPKSASKWDSDELLLWEAEKRYGALCCFVLQNLQFHAHQFITDFTTTIVKSSQKRRLTRATLLWVAFAHFPFHHRTHLLPWKIVSFM